jgi:hypothetical protein
MKTNERKPGVPMNLVHTDFFMDDPHHVVAAHPPRFLYRCDGCSAALALHGANVVARRDWRPVAYFVAEQDAYMRLPHTGRMHCTVRAPHSDSVELLIHWDAQDTQHDGFTFACALECDDMIVCSTPFCVLKSRAQ